MKKASSLYKEKAVCVSKESNIELNGRKHSLVRFSGGYEMGTQDSGRKLFSQMLHLQLWFPPAGLGGSTFPWVPSLLWTVSRTPTTETKGSSALLLKTSNAESAQGIPGPL